MTDGAERDRLWNDHVAALPEFGEYPKKTDRVIPMIAPRARRLTSALPAAPGNAQAPANGRGFVVPDRPLGGAAPGSVGRR